MAYGRHRRSVVIDSLEAGVLYSIRVQRVSRDGSVIDVPTASTSSNTNFIMLVHIESQPNAAGDSEAAPPATLIAQQIDAAKRRFESLIEDAQKTVRFKCEYRQTSVASAQTVILILPVHKQINSYE